MDNTTILFCDDTSPRVCYTASQELLDYIDTSAMNWKSLIDKQAGISILISLMMLFLISIVALKSILKK